MLAYGLMGSHCHLVLHMCQPNHSCLMRHLKGGYKQQFKRPLGLLGRKRRSVTDHRIAALAGTSKPASREVPKAQRISPLTLAQCLGRFPAVPLRRMRPAPKAG